MDNQSLNRSERLYKGQIIGLEGRWMKYDRGFTKNMDFRKFFEHAVSNFFGKS